MRFQWICLAIVIVAIFSTTATFALTTTDYLKIRNATTLTTLDSHTSLTTQLTSHPGKTVELQGDVTGMFTNEKSETFLLHVGADNVLVTCTPVDPDITVETTVRVVAQIPAQGAILNAIGVTSLNSPISHGASAAQSAIANYQVPADSITTSHTDAYHYAQAPYLTPHATPATTTAVHGVSLADQPAIVQIYANRIQLMNGRLDENTAKSIAYNLLAKSAENNIDPRLVFALIMQESRFNPHAVSRCGAMGLGQLMPGTAAALGVQHPFDIAENLDGSIRYLACQIQRFGHISLALAAYNAGPNRVENCGYQVPQISETQNYVSIIWRHYAQLAGFDPNSNGPVYTN